MTTETATSTKDRIENYITEFIAFQKSFFGVNEVAYKNLGVILARLIETKKVL